jgi:zinc transport system permease protein
MMENFLQLITTDFFITALIAGLSLAVIAGPLGSFIVWRRMSYFGDTLAHSALLGIAIGLLTESDPQLSIILSCLVLALLLAFLERIPSISTDTILGILAHSSLAIGIVFIALTSSLRVDIEAYLFGSMLTITDADLAWTLSIGGLVAFALIKKWNDFLSATVNAEIAQVEGVNVRRSNLILIVLVALTIAVAMKIVGVLLITSLLIIPPAAARKLARTPEKMALLASLIGALSVVCGLIGAFFLDTPAGPTIVVVASIFFVALYFGPRIARNG